MKDKFATEALYSWMVSQASDIVPKYGAFIYLVDGEWREVKAITKNPRTPPS